RRSLNGGGAKVGECRRRENVLRGVERRLLSALAVSQSRLAEAENVFRNAEILREAPRHAAARIPGALVADAEGRIAVVTVASLEKELVVHVEVGLREIAIHAAPAFVIRRDRA